MLTMKMRSGIMFVAVFAALALAVLAVRAQIALPDPDSTPAPMVVDIADDGTVLIRGVVESAGTDSITIMTWGGGWTVRTTSVSTVFSSGNNSGGNMSAISVGDFVGVMGRVNVNEGFTVDADIVRDWTTNPFASPSAAGQLNPTPTPVVSPTPSGEAPQIN